MNKAMVRINGVTINNFKNVVNGSISFENNRKNYKSSVLGLYGQNGSGKTALIDSLELLKIVLTGNQIPLKFSDYVNIDADYSLIEYDLKIENTDSKALYDVVYKFKIKKENDFSSQNIDDIVGNKYKTVIYDEILSCSFTGENEKNKLMPIIDTSNNSEYPFEPKNKFECLIGSDKKVVNDVKAYKTITYHTSRSFIFSRELLTIIRQNESDKKYKFLLESLVNYGNYELFVFNTTSNGLISMNALPLSFRINEENTKAVGGLMIKLDGPTFVPEDALNIVKKVISNMNIVLTQIVPGLTIGIKEIGDVVLKDNRTGKSIYLVSSKNGKEIPLKYESDGIKRIISILQLLIVLYNNSTITVAIDELDSGVFEYLLGEILKIISEKGKGQLIFTSHNLRPLETIDKGFVAFTTTNPNNRYIRFTNVKTNNNLRDFYYRDIILGEQSEKVYEETNNYEIALAFKEAGEYRL